MSTDFCVETLLRGSSSNTSITSTGSNPDLNLIAKALNALPVVKSQENTKDSHLLLQPSSSESSIIITPLSGITSHKSGSETQILDASAEVLGIPKETTKSGTKRKHPEEDSEVAVPSSKKKRVRTVYSPEQIQKLEDIFTCTQYPDLLMRESIAEELGFDEKKIYTWFQNRRAKQRKMGGNPVYNSQRMSSLPSLQSSQCPHTMITYSPLPTIPLSSPGLPHQYQFPSSRISVSPVQTAGLPTPPNTVIGTSRMTSPAADSTLPVYLPLRKSLSPLTVSSPNQLVMKSNSPVLYGMSYQFDRGSLSPQQQASPFIQPSSNKSPSFNATMMPHSPVCHASCGGPQVMAPYPKGNPSSLCLPGRRSSPGVLKSSQATPILASYLSSAPTSESSCADVSYGHYLPLRREYSIPNFVFIPNQTVTDSNDLNDFCFSVVDLHS